MGWWSTEDELLLGDRPADILGAAYAEIVSLYEAEAGRKPTRAELQRLVEFTLRPFLEHDLERDSD